jgi:hypothetical protein
MLRRVTFLVAITICATTLLSDSAIGGWRRGRCQPCHPCPTWCAVQVNPLCCDQTGSCVPHTRMYRLYYCIDGHWTPQCPDSSNYDSLYKKGKAAGRKPKHHTEGCHSHYDGGDFTIAPSSITPSDTGPTATSYVLYSCTTGGGWTYVDSNTDYDTLYNEGINNQWTPLDCSESCPGGYGVEYFTVCPYGATPGGSYSGHRGYSY